jgi:glutamate racemase
MSAKGRPIGVFDSGIGGLTVFSALRRRMPEEDLVYFGDTARLPYGSKSKDTVTRYSLDVARFLERRKIKALVIACNTSSALALEAVQKAVSVPVIGVIAPGARAAASATRTGKVGIIGTEATIASGAYSRALKAMVPNARIWSKACPLFVPLVEEGWWRHPVAAAVAREYLAPVAKAGVDTLILGCTHYPLLKTVVGKTMGRGVRLIDSAEQSARETESLLLETGLRRASGKGSSRFFVSDGPERFSRLAQRFLGRQVPHARAEVHRFD